MSVRSLICVLACSWPVAAHTEPVKCGPGEVMVGLDGQRPLCAPLHEVRRAAGVGEGATRPAPAVSKRRLDVSSVSEAFSKAVLSREGGAITLSVGKAVEAFGGDWSKLARQARIIPHYREGKPQGFKVYAIRRGSVLSQLGAKNGDVIQRINGQLISGPDLTLYNTLANKARPHDVTVEIVRRGKPVTLKFKLVD